ncbi:MAG: protein translocase subunit SecDF [Rikenellaceae bacterium]|nr:protein translocase subunit SecDF [Rikenellaceae bacterium]
MQNKGAIKFLAIVLAIACAWQLSFTFVTRSVEKKAVKYAAQFEPELQSKKEQFFLDSIRSKTVYNLGFIKYTYNECKEKEINLGLDLKGGMNVMLEISVEDVVKALSNDSKDPDFQAALAEAREAQKNSSDDFITLFVKAYGQKSGGAPLSMIFNTPDLKEYINPNSTNAEVEKVLRTQAESAIANSFNVLRNRIDRFGVTQPNIQRLENGRILVELPGVKEPERVRKLLQGSASLEFWATYENPEIYPLLENANSVIAGLNAAAKVAEQGAEEAGEAVEAAQEAQEAAAGDESLLSKIGGTESSDAADLSEQYPLFSKLIPSVSQSGQLMSGPVIGQALATDTAAVNTYLNMPQVKSLLPRDLKLIWGVKPIDEQGTVFMLYAIKANTRDGKAPLDGGAVVDAKEEYTQQGAAAEVSMIMNAAGARTWARMTADNVGRCIAIVLDGYVYSAPVVNGEITGGRSSITGGFTITEATDLANVLKSGKLPAPAHITQDTVVGPSLGQESINSGMMSFVLAFVLVLLYMWLYYNGAGLAADIALVCNLFYLVGILVSFGAVLTLPGIAGIVLTMGMAVDANVIIYERIKEEQRAGKGLSLAIHDGFKNALSAIIDGNITTLLTGIVLFIFGTGPVQGFATTLIIGIITSVFCAIFIPRMIFASRIAKGKSIRFSRSWSENLLADTHIDFIKIRKFAYILSGSLLLLTFVSLAVRGLNYGVDFSGGRSYVVRFDKEVSDEQVREALGEVFTNEDGKGSYQVKQYGNNYQMRIVTQYKYDDQSEDASAEVEAMLHRALAPLYGYEISQSAFVSTQEDVNGIISAEKVGPSIAHDITVNSFIAVVFSLLAIMIYIIVRFKKWQWGVGSVVSLTHNALLIIGLFSLFHGLMPFTMEVDQSFIAAILTIIGYSINDTVVIFDRIREHQALYPKRTIRENINNAVNSTLSRTLNTSGTTFVTLLAIFIFGGAVIRGFVFALMFGIIVGTYSSIFVATPVAYDMMRRSKRGEEAK